METASPLDFTSSRNQATSTESSFDDGAFVRPDFFPDGALVGLTSSIEDGCIGVTVAVSACAPVAFVSPLTTGALRQTPPELQSEGLRSREIQSKQPSSHRSQAVAERLAARCRKPELPGSPKPTQGLITV